MSETIVAACVAAAVSFIGILVSIYLTRLQIKAASRTARTSVAAQNVFASYKKATDAYDELISKLNHGIRRAVSLEYSIEDYLDDSGSLEMVIERATEVKESVDLISMVWDSLRSSPFIGETEEIEENINDLNRLSVETLKLLHEDFWNEPKMQTKVSRSVRSLKADFQIAGTCARIQYLLLKRSARDPSIGKSLLR